MNRLSKWFSKGQKNGSEEVAEETSGPVSSGLKTSALKDVEQRFYRFVIGKAAIAQQEDPGSELPEDRILLDIELGPALKRQAEKQASADLFNALQAQLYQTVEERVEHEIDQLDPAMLYNFTISKNLLAALEVLSTKAASTARLKPLLADERNVLRDMVNLLNRFNLCQKPGDNPLELKDAQLSLSFLGVDQLRYLLPYLAANDALRRSGQCFDQPSRRLWLHLQCTADAARLLAEQQADAKIRPDLAYNLAMLHEIGSIYLFHLIDRCFNDELQKMRRQARKDLAGDIDQLLAQVRSAVPVLDALMPKRASSLGVKLAEQFGFQYLQLVTPCAGVGPVADL